MFEINVQVSESIDIHIEKTRFITLLKIYFIISQYFLSIVIAETGILVLEFRGLQFSLISRFINSEREDG